VVTMYLLPDTVNLLRPKLLAELRPGTRIISHDYPLTGWVPEKDRVFDLQEKVAISGVTTTILWLYIVPAKVEGRWGVKLPSGLSKRPAMLELKQQITSVHGWMHLNGDEVPLEAVRLRGDQLSFRLVGHKGEFTGQVKDNAIEGTVEVGSTRSPWSATLGKPLGG